MANDPLACLEQSIIHEEAGEEVVIPKGGNNNRDGKEIVANDVANTIGKLVLVLAEALSTQQLHQHRIRENIHHLELP